MLDCRDVSFVQMKKLTAPYLQEVIILRYQEKFVEQQVSIWWCKWKKFMEDEPSFSEAIFLKC